METIEERAKEYANILGATLFMDSPEEDIIYRDDLARAYASGAKEERAELTRWHDPNITPDDNKPVIICTSPGIYYIAAYDKQFNYWFTGNGSFYRHEIIGWREIHE